jgi:hypothetical protein
MPAKRSGRIVAMLGEFYKGYHIVGSATYSEDRGVGLPRLPFIHLLKLTAVRLF